MWQYTTVQVHGSAFGSLEHILKNLGEAGWEAVGVVPIEWYPGSTTAAPTIGVLLKRNASTGGGFPLKEVFAPS